MSLVRKAYLCFLVVGIVLLLAAVVALFLNTGFVFILGFGGIVLTGIGIAEWRHPVKAPYRAPNAA